jgi:hypothetical protein
MTSPSCRGPNRSTETCDHQATAIGEQAGWKQHVLDFLEAQLSFAMGEYLPARADH